MTLLEREREGAEGSPAAAPAETPADLGLLDRAA